MGKRSCKGAGGLGSVFLGGFGGGEGRLVGWLFVYLFVSEFESNRFLRD